MKLLHSQNLSTRQPVEVVAIVIAQLKLFGVRYGYPGEFALLKCVPCGHHRLATEMNGDEIRDLYTNSYPRSSFDVEAWSPPREEGRLRVWWSGQIGRASCRERVCQYV